jgi:hypothetical protein
MSDDPQRIELSAPLPDNALAAVVSFRVARLGRDRDAPRSQATHAELEITGLDGKKRARRVELAEADEFLRAAAAVRERDRAWSEGRRDAAVAARAERAARAAAIRPDCPHCGVPRAYEGRRDIVSFDAPEQGLRDDQLGRMRPSSRPYEEYVCPRCGSVELFRSGVLDHPLAGADRG